MLVKYMEQEEVDLVDGVSFPEVLAQAIQSTADFRKAALQPVLIYQCLRTVWWTYHQINLAFFPESRHSVSRLLLCRARNDPRSDGQPRVTVLRADSAMYHARIRVPALSRRSFNAIRRFQPAVPVKYRHHIRRLELCM